jgi:hypothetical protein
VDSTTSTAVANAVTGATAREESGTDVYTLAESGTAAGGAFTQTVTGTDSYAASFAGNQAAQVTAGTTTGGGTWTRTASGPGSTLSSGNGTNDYTLTTTGNAVAGVFSHSATGTDRYDLVQRFEDVSNAAGGRSPGHVEFFSHGLPFRDPNPTGFLKDLLPSGDDVKAGLSGAAKGALGALDGVIDRAKDAVESARGRIGEAVESARGQVEDTARRAAQEADRYLTNRHGDVLDWLQEIEEKADDRRDLLDGELRGAVKELGKYVRLRDHDADHVIELYKGVFNVIGFLAENLRLRLDGADPEVIRNNRNAFALGLLSEVWRGFASMPDGGGTLLIDALFRQLNGGDGSVYSFLRGEADRLDPKNARRGAESLTFYMDTAEFALLFLPLPKGAGAGPKRIGTGPKITNSKPAAPTPGPRLKDFRSGVVERGWANLKNTAKQAFELFFHKCFPADTLVATESGPRPIREIGAGDLVWAFDFKVGEWVLRPVEARHDAVYEGAVVTLELEGGGSAEATAYHPFWVVRGMRLSERPVPGKLSAGEDEGGELPGRWVSSHELQAGDVVFTRAGKPARIVRLEQRFERLPVCNLTVGGLPNYAVGNSAVLVHNVSGTTVGGGPNKRGPKPKGTGAHNLTIERRIKELKSQLGPDWEHVGGGSKTERYIPTPGSPTHKARRPDITFRNKKTGEEYHENVGRTEASGIPVRRERWALDDLLKELGKKVGYTPFDR